MPINVYWSVLFWFRPFLHSEHISLYSISKFFSDAFEKEILCTLIILVTPSFFSVQYQADKKSSHQVMNTFGCFKTAEISLWNLPRTDFLDGLTWYVWYLCRLSKLIWHVSAQFGGGVGLCVGFSLLSGAEMIYFFTIRLFFKRYRSKHT